jgi:hypothetical protein
MKNDWMWKCLKVALFAIVFSVVCGYLVMSLWNYVMPAVFGLKAIGFGQALALFVLSKVLLGGFHRHAGGGGRGWKRHMEERWAQMTPEEREKLRAGMRGRRGCGFGRRDEAPAERTAV